MLCASIVRERVFVVNTLEGILSPIVLQSARMACQTSDTREAAIVTPAGQASRSPVSTAYVDAVSARRSHIIAALEEHLQREQGGVSAHAVARAPK